jgi:hypothetical protein
MLQYSKLTNKHVISIHDMDVVIRVTYILPIPFVLEIVGYLVNSHYAKLKTSIWSANHYK